MVKPPKKHVKRDVARALIEAAAQSNPVTGALTRIYQTTHPSASERDRDRWEHEITNQVNETTGQAGALLRRPDILACGAISPTTYLSDGIGISSVTDHGTGDWSVAFATVPEAPYHVSVDVPRGHANVVEKTPVGFRIRTVGDGEPIDTDFGFAVIGRHAT